MARINTYQVDSDIGTNDIVIGSEYGGVTSTGIPIYKTKNYRMSDLLEFFGGGGFTAETPIIIEIDSTDGHRNWKHATQSLTSTPSSVTLYAKDNYAENTPETFASVTGVTTNTTGHLTGYVLTTFTMPEEYSFNVIGDAGVDHSGSGSVDSQSQTINFEQTLTISGGDAWISTLSLDSAADKVSIYHNDVSRTDVNNTSITLEHNSVFKAVSPTSSGLSYQEAILSDAKGHLLGEKITQYTLPDYKFNIAADSANSSSPAFTTVIDIHSTSIDTLSILASAPISSIITADDTITISHDEYTAKSIDTSAVDVLDTFTSDVYGHVTAITTRTLPTFGGADNSESTAGSVGVVPAPAAIDELKFLRGDATWATIPETYNFFIDADGNSDPVSNKEITDGETLSILGGTNLSSNASSNNTITINHDTFSTTTSTHAQSPGSPGFGGNVTVLSGLTVSNGHVTNKESFQINFPSLPTYDGDDIDIDTGALSGATVISDLNFNITTNTLGHVTDANNAISTRELTLADLGYTGATDANNYVLPTDLAGDDIDIDTTALTGANVISDLDVNITTDTSGRVTDANGSVSTRVLTLADLGYTGDSDAKNHQTAAELRTAIGTGNGNLVPAQGTSGHFLNNLGAFSLPPNTNTTYSANSGVDLAGTVFSLDVTSTSANSFFQIPFFNSAANALSRDISTSSSIFFNPNSNTLSVKQISIGTTSVINTRSIFSQSSNTSGNYFEIRSTMTNGTGGSVVIGVAGAANRIYSFNQTGSVSTSRNFEIVSSGGNTADFIFGTNGNMTVPNGDVIADNFIISSDKRLKSEIKPIKEGLNVIKQFTSYNYIKGGKKESGFIAQEVQEVIPHTVYKDKEGMLSMSDRGVVAHMHKAILELEKRLILIEEKLN
jgi:hypothetical protein